MRTHTHRTPFLHMSTKVKNAVQLALIITWAVSILLAFGDVYAETNPGIEGTKKDRSFIIVPPWQEGKSHRILKGYGPTFPTDSHQNFGTGPKDSHALDFDLKEEKVYPIAKGIVKRSLLVANGPYTSYGDIVVVEHDNKYMSLYAHLSTRLVSEGDIVDTTTVIGISGAGNNVRHLHLSIYNDAKLDANGVPYNDGDENFHSIVPELFENCMKLSDGQTKRGPCENLAGDTYNTDGTIRQYGDTLYKDYAAPATATDAIGRLYVFARDSTGSMLYKVQGCNSKWPGWTTLPNNTGQQWVGSPITARDADNVIYVFTRSADGKIYYVSQDDAEKHHWSDWTLVSDANQSYRVIGQPAIFFNGSTRQFEIFIRNADNRLFKKTQQQGGGWEDWAWVADGLFSPPLIETGNMIAVGQDSNGTPQSLNLAQTSPQWTPLGSKAIGNGAIVNTSSSQLDVFIRGAAYQLIHKAQTNGTWSTTWDDYGGRLTSNPAVGQNANGSPQVFARADDGTLAFTHRANDGNVAWTEADWKFLDLDPNSSTLDHLTSDPTVIRGPDSKLKLFVWNNDEIYYGTQSAPNDNSNWSFTLLDTPQDSGQPQPPGGACSQLTPTPQRSGEQNTLTVSYHFTAQSRLYVSRREKEAAPVTSGLASIASSTPIEPWYDLPSVRVGVATEYVYRDRPPDLRKTYCYKAYVREDDGSTSAISEDVCVGPTIMALPSATSPDGCQETVLPRNDDGSSPNVTLPFEVNYFGRTYRSLYVNNNGNVTFDAALSIYTPFPLQNTNRVIIAPFFGDVDTRGSGSAPVTYSYGATTYAGHQTFCVNWVNIGYYNGHYDKLNSVQLLLIDRSDVAPGNFDIMMNYEKVQWETGDFSGGSGGLGGTPARVGFSNGSTASFELPGSGVRGAFLDTNQDNGLIYNSRNAPTQPGRYLFEVRNGVAPTGGSISGTVYANTTAAGNALSGAYVQACENSGFCQIAMTNASGRYTISGLASGQYMVTAFPPAASTLSRRTIGPLTISGAAALTSQDIVLTGPLPLPAGTSITSRSSSGGLPVVYWGEPLTLTTQGCTGGSASYRILQNGAAIRSGSMAEGSPAGSYSAAIAPLAPAHGQARVEITIRCPDSSTTTIPFDIYIDPSGTVRTVAGAPIAGATVTLYRADSAIGPFAVVPNGSAIMSPINRRNPDVADNAGHFGWDVLAGYYKVRASKAGCTAPANPDQDFVESAVLTIPPPVTDLDLRLDCPGTTPPTMIVGAGGQCASPNTPTGTLNLVVGDQGGANGLTLSASSSNQALVPNGNITFGGSGANRTATIAAATISGTAVITITVSDGQLTTQLTATVTEGTSSNNTINGTSGADILFGQGGNDTLNGRGGNDLLCGGSGEDTLNGGDNDDTLDGGNGEDTLNGNDGNDILRGNSGDDKLYGGNGDDTLDGAQGDDRLYGDNDNDTLTGGASADFFSGGLGTDTATDFKPSEGDTQDSTIP